MNDLSIFFGLLLISFIITHEIRSYLRLRHVKAPTLLASFTDVWRWYIMNTKGYGEAMVRLHRKFGPLIRLGPNRVSTSDFTAIHGMFGTNPTWEKAPSYRGAAPFAKGEAMPSIVSMTEAQSTAVHRVAGAAFTANALLDYEDYIDQSCAALLTAFKQRPKPIDLNYWFALFAMDVINRIAFSDSLGFLQSGEDVDNLMAATKDRFDHWGRWAAVIDLETLLFKTPLARVWLPSKPSPLAAAAQKKLAMRQDPKSSEFKDRPDLLGKFLDGAEKHPGLVTDKEVLGMVQSTIGAGADTTAATLSIMFVYLSRDTTILTNLRNELAAAELSDPPTWDETRKLPYLEAFIKESMRLFPVSQWGHDRVAPSGGATIAGQFVPEGTVVGCHIDSIHRDERVYGANPDSFNPQRWIEATEDQRLLMDSCMMGFGSGKRVCLGKHIAWLEMKKLVPLLLLNLDIEIINPNIDLINDLEPSSVRYMPPLPANIRVR